MAILKRRLFAGLFFAIAISLVSLLLAYCFAVLSPFELGLAQNMLLGRLGGVDSEGNFMIGLHQRLIRLPKTAISLEYKEIQLLSRDGVAFSVDLVYVMRLNPETVKPLYTAFGDGWRSFYETFAAAQVRGQLAEFSSQELANQAEVADRVYFQTEFREEFVGVFFTRFLRA